MINDFPITRGFLRKKPVSVSSCYTSDFDIKHFIFFNKGENVSISHLNFNESMLFCEQGCLYEKGRLITGFYIIKNPKT